MEKQTLGETIAALRRERQLTQAELAEKMGVTDKAVSKWERNLSCPDLSSIPRLAETLGVGVDELIQAKAVPARPREKAGASPLPSLILTGIALAMGAAVTVLIIVCLQLPEDLGTIVATASEAGKFNLGSTAFDLRQPTVWTVLIATFFTNITTYGTDQTIVQRYLTTATEREARKGVYVNAALTIPATILFFLVGTALWAFYRHYPAELSMAVRDSDAILPWYISTQLPSGVLGLIIAGLFAAAMSTLSSSMNSAATAFVTDIHRKLSPAARDGRALLRTARLSTLVLGLVGVGFALMMASWEIKSLWDEFSKILGILLGGLGGLVYITAGVSEWKFENGVAGFGFLALAVMIFGQWKPLRIALAALLFGLFRSLSNVYTGFDFLAQLNLPSTFYNMLPYIISLLVLALTSSKSRAPKAEGIPYDKGSR